MDRRPHNYGIYSFIAHETLYTRFLEKQDAERFLKGAGKGDYCVILLAPTTDKTNGR